MRVVIIAKTKMRGGVCIGAIAESTGQSLRLIPMGDHCHPTDTELEVGDVWDLDLRPRPGARAPHVEDHDVLRPGRFVGEIGDLGEWIRARITPWRGERTCLYGGVVEFRGNGTAYIPASGALPSCSTGFWELPQPMVFEPFTKSHGEQVPYFRLRGSSPVKLKYVGTLVPSTLPPELPARTLVRLSLAHLWPTAPREEDRDKYFLQLSGWLL